uniref:TetR/AcrR family transcriptional regulator n=1 Tax=Nonomuraea pusilla TaxID=46177 RepID=UPI0006E1903B|nr:TetR/AcrR family transcriptional regulator [Nonomuraea pusilla]
MGDDHSAGRPLRADARRSRERVLQVAQDALAGDGLAVPLDEIARRAGFGLGIVHRHFPTEEALVEAVLVARVERFAADARALATAAAPGEAFFGWFARLAGQAGAHRALGGLLEDGDHPAARDLAAALGPLLARAQRAGAVRRDLGPDDVHDLLLGCLAAERRARARGGGGRAVAVVCAGLRPPG